MKEDNRLIYVTLRLTIREKGDLVEHSGRLCVRIRTGHLGSKKGESGRDPLFCPNDVSLETAIFFSEK